MSQPPDSSGSPRDREPQHDAEAWDVTRAVGEGEGGMIAQSDSDPGSGDAPAPAREADPAYDVMAPSQPVFSTADAPTLDADATLAPGAGPAHREIPPPEIAGYELLGEIHRGGQGVVYRALQIETGREVAVKTMLQGAFASQRQRERFEREIETVAKLTHPNIVTIFHTGVCPDGTSYIVMELVRGRELDEVGFDSAPAKQTVPTLLALCDAVHHAHQRGVIHRDLKPANILVDEDGQPHVLDFGIAKPTDMSAQTATTMPGEFVGTLAYAAPEQVNRGEHGADVRTDVYALGVVFFEVLTGGRPYPASGSLAAVVRTIEQTPPLNPRTVRPQLDDDIAAILLRALSKEPERRYQSAEAMRRDIEAWSKGLPIEARKGNRRYVIGKFLRRHRVGVAAAAAVLLVLLGYTVTTTVLLVRLSFENARNRSTALVMREGLAAIDPETRAENPVDDLDDLLAVFREKTDALLARYPGQQGRLLAGLGVAMLPRADKLQNHEEVFAMLERAYELQVRAGDARLDELGFLKHQLGRQYWKRDMFEQALASYETALDLRARSLGPTHPETIRTRHHLAATYSGLGRLDVAERMFREVIEARSDLLGADHPEVANTQLGLGSMLRRQGRFAEARDVLQSAFETVSAHATDPNDFRVGRVAHTLGSAKLDLGEHDAAERLFARSMDIKLERPDDYTLQIALTKQQQARLAVERGLTSPAAAEAARTLAAEALEAHERASDRAAIRVSRDVLARIALQQGEANEALQHARAAVSVGDIRPVADHVSAVITLAECCYAAGEPEAAAARTLEARTLIDRMRLDEDVPLSRRLAALESRSSPPTPNAG